MIQSHKALSQPKNPPLLDAPVLVFDDGLGSDAELDAALESIVPCGAMAAGGTTGVELEPGTSWLTRVAVQVAVAVGATRSGSGRSAGAPDHAACSSGAF